MIPSFVRWAPRLVACAALFSAAAYGQVASVVVQGGFSVGAVCTSFVLGGTANQPTLTCNAGGGSTAFTCSASASPSTIASGGSSTLAMNCSGGTTPYSYSLSGGAQGQSTNQFVVSPTATTQYSLTATDAAQATSTKTPTVTVQTGGGGGGGPISCSGAGNGNGVSGTRPATLAWKAGANVVDIPAGVNDVIVVQFTAGPSLKSAQRLTGTEFGGAPAKRVAVLSTAPCDFTGSLPYSASGPGTSVNANMAVGGGGKGTFLTPLVSGQTYYWNIITLSDQTCGGSCGMRITLSE